MLVVYYIIHVLFITESYIEIFTASAQNTAVYSTSICNNDCIEPYFPLMNLSDNPTCH